MVEYVPAGGENVGAQAEEVAEVKRKLPIHLKVPSNQKEDAEAEDGREEKRMRAREINTSLGDALFIRPYFTNRCWYSQASGLKTTPGK